jgi:ferredoxin-NADP reductase
VLRGPDGAAAGPFRPGQYVSVRVTLPDGARQIRQYSLSAAPGGTDWRITVKRVRGGAAPGAGPEGEVSTWLHEHARTGDLLDVSLSVGDLVLPDGGDGPLPLASVGIGCTPMLSMLGHLAKTGSTRRITVVHADRSPAEHAHQTEQRRPPSAQRSTILERSARSCAVFDRRAHAVSCARSSASRTNSALRRPERGSSTSPAVRASANRCRHLPTVARVTMRSAATRAFDAPSAHASTIAARNASFSETAPRDQPTNSARSASDKTISTGRGPGRHIISMAT